MQPRDQVSSATKLFATNGKLLAWRPSGAARPRPSTRRISSASSPIPAAEQNLRLFTRFSGIRCVRRF